MVHRRTSQCPRRNTSITFRARKIQANWQLSSTARAQIVVGVDGSRGSARMADVTTRGIERPHSMVQSIGDLSWSDARPQERKYYRSIWISDFHLGTVRCKAESLLDFLRSHCAETLFLVGDVIDGW